MEEAGMPREPADAIGKEAVVGVTYMCTHASSREGAHSLLLHRTCSGLNEETRRSRRLG